MKRLLYLAALSMLVVLVFAPTALAQPAGGPTEPCPAQLDEYPPGTVCAEGGGYDVPDQDAAPVDQYAAPADQYSPAADQYAAPTTDPALPATGGTALLLSAGVLLLGAGLLGMKLTRRS